jgi:hypothetical protein
MNPNGCAEGPFMLGAEEDLMDLFFSHEYEGGCILAPKRPTGMPLTHDDLFLVWSCFNCPQLIFDCARNNPAIDETSRFTYFLKGRPTFDIAQMLTVVLACGSFCDGYVGVYVIVSAGTRVIMHIPLLAVDALVEQLRYFLRERAQEPGETTYWRFHQFSVGRRDFIKVRYTGHMQVTNKYAVFVIAREGAHDLSTLLKKVQRGGYPNLMAANAQLQGISERIVFGAAYALKEECDQYQAADLFALRKKDTTEDDFMAAYAECVSANKCEAAVTAARELEITKFPVLLDPKNICVNGLWERQVCAIAKRNLRRAYLIWRNTL